MSGDRFALRYVAQVAAGTVVLLLVAVVTAVGGAFAVGVLPADPAPQMCALITQPHTPVPDQRCDSPGIGRWQLIAP